MLAFLLSVVAVSLSGVMAPGPITAATLAAGARSRHAGAMIALGHAAVEVPLILLLVAGASRFLDSPEARAGIGLAGGIVLLLMGAQLLLGLRKPSAEAQAPVERHPFLTGVVFTAANPYFLVWWATAGLGLATQAAGFGYLMLAAFIVVHWLCDLGWLELLSQAGFKSVEVFGSRSQKVISAVCAVTLLGFGVKFLHDAAGMSPNSETNSNDSSPNFQFLPRQA